MGQKTFLSAWLQTGSPDGAFCMLGILVTASTSAGKFIPNEFIGTLNISPHKTTGWIKPGSLML